MAETKELIIAIIGYILAIVAPLLGLIAGVIIYFTQKENPFFNKHGKFIIILAIVVWIIGIILVMSGMLLL